MCGHKAQVGQHFLAQTGNHAVEQVIGIERLRRRQAGIVRPHQRVIDDGIAQAKAFAQPEPSYTQ